MNYILVGTPNSGKTTLFNKLTGLNEKTGNFAGITVEVKKAKIKNSKNDFLFDLPGTYSLKGYSNEESVALKFLSSQRDAKIIAIIDGTQPLKSLRLVSELTDLNIPITLAVNFIDELSVKISEYINLLKNIFKVKVVGISAKKGKNLKELLLAVAKNDEMPKKIEYQSAFNGLEKIAKNLTTKKSVKSEKIDKFLSSGVVSLLILFFVLLSTFIISNEVGGALSKKLNGLFSYLTITVKNYLSKQNLNTTLNNFIVDGLLSGVFSVVEFLPQVVLTYFFLSLFEQTGYSARIAFILHKPFKKAKLSGKAVVPMLSACGCGVNGVLATRIIPEECARCKTLTLITNLPCGAKVAVIQFLSQKFFKFPALVSALCYIISILSVPIFSFILDKLEIFGQSENGLIMEIPVLRTPSIKETVVILIKKVKEFILKAGTIIVLISILVWCLSNYDFSLKPSTTGGILFSVGKALSFIFYPLGFFGEIASSGIILGFLAKEAVITAFSSTTLNGMFLTPFSAFSYIVFILLSPPCLSALLTMKKELKSNKKFLKSVAVQFFFSYSVSLLINLLGIIVYFFSSTLKIIIIILIIFSIMLKYLFKNHIKNKIIKKTE